MDSKKNEFECGPIAKRLPDIKKYKTNIKRMKIISIQNMSKLSLRFIKLFIKKKEQF